MTTAAQILSFHGLTQGHASKRDIQEINRAADEGGTIQADDMLRLFPGDPCCRTTSTLRTALLWAGCREEDEGA